MSTIHNAVADLELSCGNNSMECHMVTMERQVHYPWKHYYSNDLTECHMIAIATLLGQCYICMYTWATIRRGVPWLP